MTTSAASTGQVLALCGGVGGAKLALGLYQVLGPDRLVVVANTGDDFEHLGLHIAPDLDTITYTLAGLNDPERGWGRAGETWAFMAALEQLGGETWFRLGDGDLAMHVERTRRLHRGDNLTAIATDFAARLGIGVRILPMTDDPVRTLVHTREGDLPFQHYFVKRGCAPVVTGVTFLGAAAARPSPAVLAALADPDLCTIVLCPSNPYLSIDPILAMPGLRAALQRSAAPVIAVSPVIGGRAVKGPTAKIMAELGVEASSAAVVAHYRDLLDGLVIDAADASDASELALPVEVTKTLMTTLEDRRMLARAVLSFADRIRRREPVSGTGSGGA